ncbi:hypothetical protein DH2020_029609 [Rehmannia glutinosa]|uniref:EF-hand domain-containing protein n=1 Tax=Rehmannia glutinosa TaxID=99300 RepID=A0ABR0VQQ6_REHGL
MKEKSSSTSHEVMDGSDIMELVENEKVFSNFVDHKFEELDIDCDGKLSVKELQPAVEDIGAALGLPAHGTSPDSDHIYTQDRHAQCHVDVDVLSTRVLNEFTHGDAAFYRSLVMSNILEPALESVGGAIEQPVSQETFLAEFKRAAENVVQLLKDQPAIVAHSQNTFDGSGVKRLLSNKFELEKVNTGFCYKECSQRSQWENIERIFGVALDSLAASAGLPPLGAVDQMDKIMTEALKMFDAGDGKTVKEDEFKKLLTEVLGSIMLQLEGNPVSVSINSGRA